MACVGCRCLQPLPFEWGYAPYWTQLYEAEFEEKINGLRWTVRLVVRLHHILSDRGIHDALYASPAWSIARTRNRKVSVSAMIIPACDGGSLVSFRLDNKREQLYTTHLPPLAYVLQGKVTVSRDYALFARARQPVQRKAMKLLTSQDRTILLYLFMCMRYSKALPTLPAEIREMILRFLNLADLFH